jgi:hypothetical protein
MSRFLFRLVGLVARWWIILGGLIGLLAPPPVVQLKSTGDDRGGRRRRDRLVVGRARGAVSRRGRGQGTGGEGGFVESRYGLNHRSYTSVGATP